MPMPNRAISNTIAGLIVLTFLIVTLVPLIINMLTTSTQQGARLAQSIIEKIAQASPALNITLNYKLSNTATKVYDIVNTDTIDHTVSLLKVEDANGDIYLVKAGPCASAGSCTAGTAQVKIIIVNDALISDKGVLLHPQGSIRVEVSYGKLLGLMLRSGGYAKVQVPPPPPPTAATNTSKYAEVAGSVKTNYFQLSHYKDINDLVNSNDVALTTSPDQSSTNKNILWKNMIKSRCIVGGSVEVGGFRPRQGLNGTTITGIGMFDIEPYGGTFILGGGGGNYDQYPFSVRLLMSAYTLTTPPDKELGLVVARSGDSWVAAFAIPDYVLITENNTAANDAILAWRNFIPQKMYREEATITTYLGKITDYEKTNVQAYFDVPYLGVVLNYTQRINWEKYHFMVYCPANAGNVSVNQAGDALITVSRCDGIAVSSYSAYYVRYTDMTIKINNGRYHGDASTGYIWGNSSYAYIRADKVEFYDLADAGSTALYDQPFRMKFEAATSLIEVYNDITGSMEYGKKVFGYYFYNGNSDYENSYFHAVMLRNVQLTVFEFAPGDTSGIAPFTHIMDTDGNGLLEIVFSDEDISPGWKNTWDDYTTIYIYGDYSEQMDVGCEEVSLNKLFMKFIGDNYAINGSRIAQVSIQVRYTFHDNAGDDVDDVDDPKQYIMSFQLITPNGTVFMSSDYIYQQLQNLEDTWPPNHNWVSDSVFLLVPNSTGSYYVAYVVNDPYDWESTNNDPDFTLAVEWLGMWYLHR